MKSQKGSEFLPFDAACAAKIPERETKRLVARAWGQNFDRAATLPGAVALRPGEPRQRRGSITATLFRWG
jgi:hypothetical protein